MRTTTARRELPTTFECWERLQRLDEALAAAPDNRRRSGLLENRHFWEQQLKQAQAREGYPGTFTTEKERSI
jgi:hypothetical protein